MYEVVLSPEAEAFYVEADRPLARRLSRCFAQLEREPYRHGNIRRLAGNFAGLLRFRAGDWRVLYQIDEASNRVNVLVIAHRREVYE